MAVLSLKNINESPYRSLVIVFLTWKILLLILALLSPGLGYDTSTDLLLQSRAANSDHNLLGHAEHRLSSKLVRWDAIYFVSIAEDGYIYEQQWAFSWALTTLIRTITRSRNLQISFVLRILPDCSSAPNPKC